MQYASSVLLETPTGKLIFQHRDDIPNITDPGMVSTFGGHSELEDLDPLATAIRELEEETGLKLKQSSFKFFSEFKTHLDLKRPTEYVFLVKNINPNDIVVYEGQGAVVVSKKDDLSKIPLAPFSRYLINLYWGI